MAKETAIAYGIEFYVGRRSRDRAVSDIRAAGEMVNQQALKAYKDGAAQRQQAHETAVKKLHKSSETAIGKLAESRKKASKAAAQTFESMKPPTPEDYSKGRNLSKKELEEYTASFKQQIRSMDSSLAGFAGRASDLGMEFSGTDVDSVMEGFGQGDAPARKAALDEQQAQIGRGQQIVKQKKQERDLQIKSLKDIKSIQKETKTKLTTERATLKAMKKTDKNYKSQVAAVRKLERLQTKNKKIIESTKSELENTVKALEEQVSLNEADKNLLRELKKLHSEISADEIRTGKKIRENKEKERKLDKQLSDSDRKAISQLKEQNRLMTEYARHIDEAAAKIGGTLKTAFVVGTAAIAALNYKLMEVVGAFTEFEKQLINANSIWQESKSNLYDISDEIVKFGLQYGISTEKAAEGLYQMASAGLTAAQSSEMLTHTLKLAMATQGDHNTLAKLTTQTIMGFGMEMSEAETITDKFAHAINKSLIEWDDLASSVKFALPFFTSTGQSVDQLLGGLEILTNRALEAGIAGRGLRQALAEFAQHANDNTAAFRKMGVEILNTDGSMKQLTEIAKEYNNAMGEGVTDMDAMVSMMEDLNVRGATAFVHLAQNADEFKLAVDDLANSAGAATQMAEEQQLSLYNQVQVLKTALMAPFFLQDKEIAESTGYLNKFALEVHGIVDVVEGLFVKTMDDGSVALSDMGATMRDFVIGAMIQAKEVMIIIVDIIQDFAGSGNDLTGMLKAMTIPLKLLTKLMRFFGSGFLETVVLFKVMNGLLPMNSAMLAKNYAALLNNASARTTSTIGQKVEIAWGAKSVIMTKTKTGWANKEGVAYKNNTMIKRADILMDKKKVVSNFSVVGSFKALAKSQAAVQIGMFAMIALTQKFAKNSIGAAAAIGALAGAFFGLSIAQNALGVAKNAGNAAAMGVPFWTTIALSAAAGAGFNVMMQQMMKPPDMDGFPELDDAPTMDMGGRFLSSRTYDMGGRYTQEHGIAVLKQGESVIPKTQNMLGSGITLNMGDVHVQDGEDFAERVAIALPSALQRVSETGGI